MTRQIALGYGAPSRADLENRIHALEVKVISLTEAVTLLARALENGSPPGAGDDDADDAVAQAARQAYEQILPHHQAETTAGRSEEQDKAGEPGRIGRPDA